MSPMAAILTQQRAQFMQEIARRVNNDTKSFGIQVIDVRIKRVDLPPANSQAIFSRMQTQREQAARQIRAEGQKDAVTLRAEADKQAVVIVANARKQAEILRGEGDGEATAVYAAAYGRDPAFFDFYRSMQALDHRPSPAIRPAMSARRTAISSAISWATATTPRRRRATPVHATGGGATSTTTSP